MKHEEGGSAGLVRKLWEFLKDPGSFQVYSLLPEASIFRVTM